MADRMRHLNGHLLCAVDCETTGLIPGHHDLWQIAILPLDNFIKPRKDIMPLYLNMRVKRPENIDKQAIKIANVDFYRLQELATDPWTAADMLDDWVQSLNLAIYKKISPLAHNWPFDRAFIKDWLGEETYEQLFFHQYRDTLPTTLFLNDVASFKAERIEHPKLQLNYMAKRMGIVNEKAHDALQDCITTAEVYRRLILEV